jgi:hypothetical protein
MAELPGVRDFGRLRADAFELGGVLYAGYDELIGMKDRRRPRRGSP